MNEQDRYRLVYVDEELCEDCHDDMRGHVVEKSPFSDTMLALCHEPTCRIPE